MNIATQFDFLIEPVNFLRACDSDFKFTNNFDHPVYISAYAGGGVAGAQIYGCSKDRVGVSIKTTKFTYNGLEGAKTYRTITKNGKSETKQMYTAVYNG